MFQTSSHFIYLWATFCYHFVHLLIGNEHRMLVVFRWTFDTRILHYEITLAFHFFGLCGKYEKYGQKYIYIRNSYVDVWINKKKMGIKIIPKQYCAHWPNVADNFPVNSDPWELDTFHVRLRFAKVFQVHQVQHKHQIDIKIQLFY